MSQAYKFVYNGIESEKLHIIIMAIEGMVMEQHTEGVITKVYEDGATYEILYFEWLDGKPLWMGHEPDL